MLAWAPEPEEVIARARAEAEAILGEARTEAAEIRERAYEQGFQQGRSEGLAPAKAELLADVQRIGEIARNVVVDTKAIYRSLEDGVVQLALAIAEKVVHKHLGEDRSLVASVVKGALEQLDAMEIIRVRVNPEDLEFLRSYWEQGQIDFGGKAIELTPDRYVQVGGCVIDTNSSVVDAQIDTVLAEIEKAFQAELGNRTR